MSNAQNVQEVGWDEVNESSGGLYLTLREKGDKARIRIVSAPIKFEEAFKDTPDKMEVRFACVVIHKEIGQDGEVVKNVKGYKYGWQIYKSIQTLWRDADWGDPGEYDLEITRTEEKGKYYTVTPKPKKELSEEDKQLVLEANLDLVAMYTGEKASDQEDPFSD